MALSATSVLPRNLRAAAKRESGSIQVSPRLIRIAALSATDALSELATGPDGLTEEEAQRRLEEFGPNVVADEERFTRLRLFIKACLNPLVILLAVLATISFATAQNTSDNVGGMLMVVMVVLGVSLRFIQEARADAAAAKLKAMIRVTATVVRERNRARNSAGRAGSGDIVKLAAGDMIPADVRILSLQRPVSDPGQPDRRVVSGREIRCARSARRQDAAGTQVTSVSWAPASKAVRPPR